MTSIDIKGGSQPLTPEDDQAALEKAENERLEEQRQAEGFLLHQFQGPLYGPCKVCAKPLAAHPVPEHWKP
ncbi:MAG TPA: hypothetical protein VKW04_24890 [Planctomycetota bacterium]|nr:hypothetical protein [Planctomycetota bacterium]